MSARETAAWRFAATLAELLRQAAAEGKYEDLVVVAPPRFLGLVRGELDPQVQKRLQVSLDKDYSKRSVRELKELLQKRLAEQPLLH